MPLSCRQGHIFCRLYSCLLLLLPRFGDTADADIDVGDSVPGWIVGVTGCRKIEDTLKGTYGFGCGRSVDTVSINARNSREVACDTV